MPDSSNPKLPTIINERDRQQSGPALVYDGFRSIWAANSAAGTVSRISILNAALDVAINVASQPCSLAFDGTYIYVARCNSNQVTRVTKNGVVVDSITVGHRRFRWPSTELMCMFWSRPRWKDRWDGLSSVKQPLVFADNNSRNFDSIFWSNRRCTCAQCFCSIKPKKNYRL